SRLPPGECSAAVRERVAAARQRQWARSGCENARLEGETLRRDAALPAAGQQLLDQAAERFGLSARAHDRIRRIARTIADLAGAESLEPAHVAEAIGYRLLDRQTS